MKRDSVMIRPLSSSFLSCEKDIEIILRKLFIESQPHSDFLKRLLVLSGRDCLDNQDQEYNEIIKTMSLKKLRDDGYIILEPRVRFKEHDDIKAYIIISFDNFTPNGTNPEYRDCTVNFDIICHTDCWDIGNYRMRPLKIAGYIDGILNGTHLSGIGKFLFMGCSELILNEELSGYTLSYLAVHNVEEKADEE